MKPSPGHVEPLKLVQVPAEARYPWAGHHCGLLVPLSSLAATD